MSDRLDVLKTYKLFIDGKFPRSESGRSTVARAPDGRTVAHVSRASRKDLREAVEAARRAQPGWAGASAYNRGQVLYRVAEMLEGKRAEFVDLLRTIGTPSGADDLRSRDANAEVSCTIDRLVHYAGWADKYAQVLGCNNPVSGPYYNFTVPEPTGVVAAVAPSRPALLGLVSLIAPALCAGNAVVALASDENPLPACVLGEVCATSDVPAGVVNILTPERGELLGHVASHRDIDAAHAAGLNAEEEAMLRAGIAENLKRVTVRTLEESGWYDDRACQSPWWIEPFVEMKTMWHPASS